MKGNEMQPLIQDKQQQMAALETVAAGFPPEDTMSKRVVHRWPDRHPEKAATRGHFSERKQPRKPAKACRVYGSEREGANKLKKSASPALESRTGSRSANDAGQPRGGRRRL